MPSALFRVSKQIAIAVAVWLVGGTGIGFAIAALIGEHGSIIWAILGFAIGIAGAITHAILLCVPGFRQQSHTRQTIALWLATIFALAAFVVMYYLLSSEAPKYSPKEIGYFISIYVAAPTLLASAIVSHVVAHRPAA